MNIYDIAEMAGVSIATVSRVMSGSDKVSERTRQRVLDVIEQSGYTPNVFAQGLGIGTMHSIGILVPDISDLYMSSAVSYLEKSLREHGYNCLLGCSGFDSEHKAASVQMLLSKRIDALVLVGSTYSGSGASSEETEYIREAAAQVPVFLINGAVSGDNIFCSVCDDRQAVRDVVRAMLSFGRKHILFLTDSHSYSAREKKAGYEEALREAGCPVDEALMLHVPNRIHPVRDLLLGGESIPPFDAVIATDDGMAVGAVKYAKVLGRKVPEELYVVGYNNSSLSVSCEPELTSIDNQLEQLCSGTIDHLMRVLDGEEDVPRRIVLPGSLVQRSTTQF